MSFASKELHLNRTAVLHVWTDSQLVLDWIESTKQRKTFVVNRLTETSTMYHQLHWHYIPTTLNPADHGTQGLEPRESHEKWCTPPAFLKQLKYLWQDNTLFATTVVAAGFQRRTKHKKLSVSEPIFDIKRFSSWNKLFSTLTTVMSFISKLQIRIFKRKTNQNPFSSDEIAR